MHAAGRVLFRPENDYPFVEQLRIGNGREEPSYCPQPPSRKAEGEHSIPTGAYCSIFAVEAA